MISIIDIQTALSYISPVRKQYLIKSEVNHKERIRHGMQDLAKAVMSIASFNVLNPLSSPLKDAREGNRCLH
jgi:hypothetical protein